MALNLTLDAAKAAAQADYEARINKDAVAEACRRAGKLD